MTEYCFVANIGQRDLRLDHERLRGADAALSEKLERALGVGRPNLRKWAGLLLDNFDAVAPYLEAPILGAALHDIALRGETPGRVILIGTKQENKEFLAGDTFRCAEALRRLLSSVLPNSIRIETHTIGSSPHDLNVMLSEYAGLCSSIQADHVYALCTGGTTACNMALSLRAVEYFGEHCTVMHVAEGTAAATHLNIGRYILDQHRRASLERLALRGDFDAIAEDVGYARPVRSLARAAALRLNFNFKESLHVLQSIQCSVIEEDMAPLLVEGLGLAKESDRSAALAEVYWNALLKWRRDECADCLGRVWRLLEGTLQDVIGAAMGHVEGPERFSWHFEAWTRNQPVQYREYVHKKMDRKDKGPEPDSFRANIPILITTLGYFINHDADALRRAGLDAERALQLKRTAGALRPLADMRNASVIAHGFGGVWKNRILNQLKAGNDVSVLPAQLRALLAAQRIEPGEDPYERYGRALIKLNKEVDHDAA